MIRFSSLRARLVGTVFLAVAPAWVLMCFLLKGTGTEQDLPWLLLAVAVGLLSLTAAWPVRRVLAPNGHLLVTVPFVLLLLDYWPLDRFAKATDGKALFQIPRRLMIEKLPLFGLSAISCVATLFAVSNDETFFNKFGFASRHIPELDRERSEVSKYKGVYAKDLSDGLTV